MIELTPNAAIMIYLFLTLLVLLSLWGWNHYRSRKKTLLSSEYALSICEYCHHAYLAAATNNVNQCPQCKSYNKHNAYK